MLKREMKKSTQAALKIDPLLEIRKKRIENRTDNALVPLCKIMMRL